MAGLADEELMKLHPFILCLTGLISVLTHAQTSAHGAPANAATADTVREAMTRVKKFWENKASFLESDERKLLIELANLGFEETSTSFLTELDSDPCYMGKHLQQEVRKEATGLAGLRMNPLAKVNVYCAPERASEVRAFLKNLQQPDTLYFKKDKAKYKAFCSILQAKTFPKELAGCFTYRVDQSSKLTLRNDRAGGRLEKTFTRELKSLVVSASERETSAHAEVITDAGDGDLLLEFQAWLTHGLRANNASNSLRGEYTREASHPQLESFKLLTPQQKSFLRQFLDIERGMDNRRELNFVTDVRLFIQDGVFDADVTKSLSPEQIDTLYRAATDLVEQTIARGPKPASNIPTKPAAKWQRSKTQQP